MRLERGQVGRVASLDPTDQDEDILPQSVTSSHPPHQVQLAFDPLKTESG